MNVALDWFGADAVLPDIASRLSCRDPEGFGNSPCVISYVELVIENRSMTNLATLLNSDAKGWFQFTPQNIPR